MSHRALQKCPIIDPFWVLTLVANWSLQQHTICLVSMTWVLKKVWLIMDNKCKYKEIPVLAWRVPEGFRWLRLPEFLENRQGCQPYALPAAFTPGDIPGTQFC